MLVGSKIKYIKQNLLGEYSYIGVPHFSDEFVKVFNNESYSVVNEALWQIFWLRDKGEKFGHFQKFEYLGIEFVLSDEIGYVSAMMIGEFTL